MPVTIGAIAGKNGTAKHRFATFDQSRNEAATENGCLRIALVNNMPDSAFEETELQFRSLLEAASSEHCVRMTLYSLPGNARGGRVQAQIESKYCDWDGLWESHFDAVIITGTEPRHARLNQEPYWPELTRVLDWAERNTSSAILSCLAAHASVLHSDGIERRPLSEKRFGLFLEQALCSHMLTDGMAESALFPHSRWNELGQDELTSAGYKVLTASAQGGPNLFAKARGESLFVYFQGHPEYSEQALLKEYRRDVGRFLRKEIESYPCMPREYFDKASASAATGFQEQAMRHRSTQMLAEFPEDALAKGLKNFWHEAAVCVYGNWLTYVASRKATSANFALAAPASRS